jgi:hypothetical protein
MHAAYSTFVIWDFESVIESVSLLAGMNKDSTFYSLVSMPKPDWVVESCSRKENTETIGVEGSVGDETTSLKAKKPGPCKKRTEFIY